MSSEVIIAYDLCRGKVFLYKQQLLNRFSNDHIPIQFGVDYSSKIKFQKFDSQTVDNKSKTVTSNIAPTCSVTDLSPVTRKRNEIRHETFETVSKIKFQKSPSVNRKVIQITSKPINHQPRVNDNQPISQQSDLFTTNPLIQTRPKNFYVANSTNECPSSIEIACLYSPLDGNIRVKEYIDNQLLSSNPELVSNGKMEKLFRLNKTSSVDQYSSKQIKSDTVDPTLLSVSQRAKSLMNNKTSQSVSRSIPMNPLEMQSEETDESVLSIKDRIKLFKESLNQSVTTPTRLERPQRYISNRLKTQPLSFDDIARANAMILDQSEVGSTIASPSITNSNETLIDFSEDSNSSSNKINENKKLRKSNAILRTQSCLVNQKPNIQPSIFKEEITPTIKVQDFIKNCDEKNREITPQKFPHNAVVSRKLAFKIKTEKEQVNNKSSKVYTKRAHLTQPITKSDIENSNMNISETKESIKDRISKMQMEGENNWKNRLHKQLDIDSKERPGSVVISSLQEQLKFHNDKWKDRVEQKDVKEFTASSRLYKSMRSNKITKRYTIHGQASKDDLNDNNTVVRLRKCSGKDGLPPKQTFISDIVVDNSKSNYTQELNHSKSANVDMTKNDSLSVVNSQKVTVPHLSDQSLSKFFRSLSSSPEQQSTPNINCPTNDDFDEIFLKSDLSLNINKRSIKPNRRQKNTSRNPLKKLNERSDIYDEYDEIITGIAEREVKRCHIENIQAKAGFAEEALAGLSTKEDFSKIKLKRTESSKLFEQFVSPYKDVMLISIKGRRHVQVRLVEPMASSINLGDCYLLLTKHDVFIWIGECANVIEANKANELGSWIAKCKDLNYSGTSDKPIVIKQNDSDANELKFWKSLQYTDVQNINPPGDVSEDELYEQMIQRTNIVYKVVSNQLIPYKKFWGTPLTHQILSTDKVFIFDFGTELYLWTGFKADKIDKTHGKNFLKIVYSKGYDYEECSINPLDPLPNNQQESKPRKGMIRPNWTIVGRLSQKGETTLFKEKFIDWPETSRLIKSVIKSASFEGNKSLDGDLDLVDINNLLNLSHPSVHITIDGKSVGRGGKWKVIDDGILREFSVTTKNISMWHITDNEAVNVDQLRMGQFFSCDAYIIRWDYELKTHGRYTRNTKSGNLSSAFFFWQGSSTSITEKTACALLTVNLDTDHCTQIRVKQHHESPAFCRLFDGAMIVYTGKQKSFESVPKRRLFIIRGEIESEAHFVEVVCESQSLRSRSVFMLLNNEKKKCYIWIGNLASEESKSSVSYCLERLKEKKPLDFCTNFNDIKMEKIMQGRESRTFWEDMGILRKWKSSYNSSSLEPIRGWYVSPSFILTELVYSLYPDNDNRIITAFPLLQSVLYKASQPALFLIWTPSQIYIWEGWWIYSTTKSVSSCEFDEEDEGDINLSDTALPKNRIAAEKLALLKSVYNWLKQSEKDIPATIVYAGLEPSSFQELFPFWETHEEARNINMKRGRTIHQEDDISQTLDKYLTMTYSVDVLRKQPLPENVIPTRIESYLTDESFEDLFKMTKDDFYYLSPWKQKERKKEVNLF